jgi:hypothetical protein
MRKITLVTFAGAVLLVLLVWVIFWRGARGPIKVAVVFRGFTNDVTGSRLAAFGVTNLGGGRVFRWPFYAIEQSGVGSATSREQLSSGLVLSPGQFSICLVPAPTNISLPWRAVLHFSADNWRRKLAGLPSPVRGVLQFRGLSTPVTESLSDWIGGVSPSPRLPAYRDRMVGVIVRSPAKQQQTNGTAITPLVSSSQIATQAVSQEQTNGNATGPPVERQ